ncbi:uncharacterized protein K444DRAFT_622639 [Hyaloscypha bicolor E]|uniref:Uncharacterized protein n=1 Tax=Hyaloscypha bicolor E TaxID=1095630 RepID=A0A2J6SFL5_9HELO|nr:uncharacterized protein K444DRAFT_622639 [Hyaloscypha bicolor E]PMD49557.1 hypothetical protein K444DRAFT_622639 [Hyaloscypha bicolor E]
MSRHDEKVSPLRPSGLTEQAYPTEHSQLACPPWEHRFVEAPENQGEPSWPWLPLLVAAAAAAALFPSHSPSFASFSFHSFNLAAPPEPCCSAALLLCCPAAPVFHSFRRTSPNPKPGSTQGLSRGQQESRTG